MRCFLVLQNSARCRRLPGFVRWLAQTVFQRWADVQPKLDENARFRVLRLLEKRPDVSQREIADEIGLGVGSVNYVLRALVEKGLVKLGNFKASENRRRYSCILTPKGITEKVALTKAFLVRMLDEYEALTVEIEELESETNSHEPGG